jgi:hypothetical protein
MYVKLMSGEDMPDANDAKPYHLIECKSVLFIRDNGGQGPAAVIDNDTIRLTGNAYVLNAQGKTIDSFPFSYTENLKP